VKEKSIPRDQIFFSLFSWSVSAPTQQHKSVFITTLHLSICYKGHCQRMIFKDRGVVETIINPTKKQGCDTIQLVRPCCNKLPLRWASIHPFGAIHLLLLPCLVMMEKRIPRVQSSNFSSLFFTVCMCPPPNNTNLSSLLSYMLGYLLSRPPPVEELEGEGVGETIRKDHLIISIDSSGRVSCEFLPLNPVVGFILFITSNRK
jgi:hypothetical protein